MALRCSLIFFLSFLLLWIPCCPAIGIIKYINSFEESYVFFLFCVQNPQPGLVLYHKQKINPEKSKVFIENLEGKITKNFPH